MLYTFSGEAKTDWTCWSKHRDWMVWYVCRLYLTDRTLSRYNVRHTSSSRRRHCRRGDMVLADHLVWTTTTSTTPPPPPPPHHQQQPPPPPPPPPPLLPLHHQPPLLSYSPSSVLPFCFSFLLYLNKNQKCFDIKKGVGMPPLHGLCSNTQGHQNVAIVGVEQRWGKRVFPHQRALYL